MRTSGHGGGDGMMSAVPIGILVVFVLGMVGGFRPSLRAIEQLLWSAVAWISALVS
jgi:hypothetical protein